MPSVSERQHKAMEAAAHGHSDLGIPRVVGEEFVAKDDAPQAAGILYLNAGRVLLILRGPDAGDFPNTWSFPAGHIEDGESPLDAALRESLEEIDFVPGVTTPLLEDGSFALFLARDSFRPVLNDESVGYAWAPVDSLPQPLHPGVAEAVARAVAECAPETPGMDERAIDTNGWPEIKDNPISKVGVFDYRGSQIPGAPDPNKMYRVYRPEDELSSPETIESFKLLPWIDNHVMLGKGAGLTPAEQKGVQGVIGQDVHFQDDTLYGNLKVFSNALSGLIDAGKRELSCGYRCTYDWTSGVWNGQPYDAVQRNIRGNHLALVKSGRMGPDVAVLDHSDTDRFVFTCDSTFEVNMPEKELTDTGAGEGANKGASLEELRTQFAEFLPKLDAVLQIAAAMKSALGEGAEAEAATDAEGAKKKAEDAEGTPAAERAEERDDAAIQRAETEDDDEKAETPVMDEAAIARAVSTRIAARDKIADRLAKHIGTFDSSAMDEQEVAEYGVGKLGIKGIQKGHEKTALDVYLSTVKAPSERPATQATGMDGANSNWLNKQRAALGR